jgi:hypothetical protein
LRVIGNGAKELPDVPIQFATEVPEHVFHRVIESERLRSDLLKSTSPGIVIDAQIGQLVSGGTGKVNSLSIVARIFWNLVRAQPAVPAVRVDVVSHLEFFL